jgi:hypothetical protein
MTFIGEGVGATYSGYNPPHAADLVFMSDAAARPLEQAGQHNACVLRNRPRSVSS